MRLKVSTSNFYVGNPHPATDAKFLSSLDCDISGIQEGHSGNAVAVKYALRRTHETFWGKRKSADKQLALMDVPVVYKKDLQVYRTWARQISKRAQTKNIGMPRGATAVRFEKDGVDITFINTHTNAAVQNRNTGDHLSTRVRRVVEYVAGMVVVEQMIKNAQRRGDKVVIVGDLNFAPTKAGVWRWSPQAMFKRRHLKYVAHHIDYIAFSKSFTASKVDLIPTSDTGSDHAWMTLVLHHA